MNAPSDPRSGGSAHEFGADGTEHDPVLEAAGSRLRADALTLSPEGIQLAVLRRRARRLTVVLAAAVLVIALGAGALAVTGTDGKGNGDTASAPTRAGGPKQSDVEGLVASLARKPPVDPRKVTLVSSVSTFGDCGTLMGDLRRVGAEHVGSRGFGDVYGYGQFNTVGAAIDVSGRASAASFQVADKAASSPLPATGSGSGAGGETLGTNVQVVGVDELDSVKAVGNLIYDLDGKGNLRITDATTLAVRSTLDVTPKPIGASSTPPRGGPQPEPTDVSQLLVSGDRVVIFGTETEISKPVAGDPSATRAATTYLTITFVDASDVAHPTITDRVRVEGALVSARMVNGQVRLVTTSNMSDLGFVMPTTPLSVTKALEENRRSVASSTASDWIPDWQRSDGAPQPLVPCDRVHVPDTFSGVAMTSMVTFPVASGRFEPAATSILAPGDTLYAGLDTVAISSQVWVDPIDRERLKFDDWQTAIHEFKFTDGSAPGYEGSGIVDGSTIGQFAFGEIGGSLGVVTTKGTPWAQDLKTAGIDLTVLRPDGSGHLDVRSKIADLADKNGEVSAVRFVTDRVLVSTGFFGRDVYVIDVTDPAAPRRAGQVTVPGNVGYFHPLPDGQALMVGSRTDTVGTGKNRQSRNWVQASLLDVTNADAPKVINTWEQPWSTDEVSADHHAFTYWPARKLAMWGVQDTRYSQSNPYSNHAVVLGVTDAVHEVAVPVVNKPNETAPPCPSMDVSADVRDLIGTDGVVLRCDDGGTKEVTWPRYECYRVDDRTVARFVAPDQRSKAYFACSPAPMPHASRVLVVSGRPILYTDQTLESLDPTTFASTGIAYHPNTARYVY